MQIPGTQTTLTLQEITIGIDSSGMPTLSAPVTVQDLSGVLLPVKSYEKEQWLKIGIDAEYSYYVSPSQFTSTANTAKLVEKNVLVSTTKTYEIVGIKDYSYISNGGHYKLILRII